MSDDAVTFFRTDITPSKVVRGETLLLLATAEAVRALLKDYIENPLLIRDHRPLLRDLEVALERMRA